MMMRALVLSGLTLATAGYLVSSVRAEPTPIRQPLADLPLNLGAWQGRVLPDPAPEILVVLGLDDFTFRSYVRPGQSRIGLYVGYHASQRYGDTIHSPLNCLPGAGWTPREQRRTIISVVDPHSGNSRNIEVNRVVIERGLDRQLVLYWYQSHNRVIASEYWGKIYTVVDAIRLNRTDAALVRVLTPLPTGDSSDVSDIDADAREFVQVLFPALGRHLPS